MKTASSHPVRHNRGSSAHSATGHRLTRVISLKMTYQQQPTTIFNFRDVGSTVNHHLNRPFLKPGLLFRSARPDDASDEDRTYLISTLHITHIIDLRSPSEIPPTTNPTNLPRISVPLPTLRHKLSLLSQLTLVQFLTLLTTVVLYGPSAAKAYLAQTILIPWGLTRLTIHGLAYAIPEIAGILRCLIPPLGHEPSATLIHCAQGKDRTGLVISILLLLLGIPVEAIDYDYRLSDNELDLMKSEKLVGLSEHGLSEEFARTAEGLVEKMDVYFKGEHGSVKEFLKRGGMTEEEMIRLRQALLINDGREEPERTEKME